MFRGSASTVVRLCKRSPFGRGRGSPAPRALVRSGVAVARTGSRAPLTSLRGVATTACARAGGVEDAPSFSAEERDALREAIGSWVVSEVTPNLQDWEEAGEVPRNLYQSAGSVGLLGAGYPAEYGGTPMPLSVMCGIWEDVARLTGSGGIGAALGSHSIAIPPILSIGSRDLQAKVVPPVLAGEKVAALAITEPSGGSDVARIKTVATRDGDDYIINGSKIFITSGVHADFYTVAVGHGRGPGELSLLLVEKGTPGFTQTPLKKQGWWCSDTAALHFDDVRVPASNLIGKEGGGFKGIMYNFNQERIWIAVQALGLARACYAEALQWAGERETFGRRLITRQVIRHKLVDMFASIETTAALLASVVARVEAGDAPVPTICILKNQAVSCMQFCADEGLQILGGSGYMRGGACERVYREVKVLAIGGGATEIMKDLAARQLGW